MEAIRRAKQCIAWLAMVALFGNLIAGALTFAPAGAGNLDYPADLLGPLVICSGHGTQTLPPDGGNPSKSSAPHCPMCLAAASAVFVAAESAALFVPWMTAHRVSLYWFQPTLSESLRRAGLGSRAPPLPA